MADISKGETNSCTFLWKIENINYSWLKEREKIQSPEFIADGVEGTTWSLSLYPMGFVSKNHLGVHLYRKHDCNGLTAVEVNIKFAFLHEDGSVLREVISKKRFEGRWDFAEIYELRSKIFFTDKEAFLPNDTLTIQCMIWKKDEAPVESSHISARTVFKIDKRTSVWKIDKFSSLKPYIGNKFKDDIIEFDLIIGEILDGVKKLDVDIVSFKEILKRFSFKISVINSDGGKEECGAHEFFFDDLQKGIISLPQFTKMLMGNKTRYLPNDVLSLVCEYACSNGDILNELFNCGIISSEEKTIVVEQDKSLNPSVLIESLKSMLNDDIFSDVEICTSTKTFPAHKSILSVRSPVFRRMFSNDMKEKNSGRVYITDIEDDTVHRMLLYIYTDAIEDPDMENACRLYEAADKYEILSLRGKCASYLKDNLCPTTVCEVLILAARHQDEDLKSTVVDFILQHDKEVFGSQKWKQFMTTDIYLAADVMHKKLYPG